MDRRRRLRDRRRCEKGFGCGRGRRSGANDWRRQSRRAHGGRHVSFAEGPFRQRRRNQQLPLTIVAKEGAIIRGIIAGDGGIRLEGPSAAESTSQPIALTGDATNTYKGPTTLARGVLRLAKSVDRLAIPGDLALGGSAPENRGDGVVWGADGQFAAKATITISGTQPAFLDIGRHRTKVAKLVLSKVSMIRTAEWRLACHTSAVGRWQAARGRRLQSAAAVAGRCRPGHRRCSR